MDMNPRLYEKLAQLQWLLHKQQIRGWAENGPLADTTRGQGRVVALLKMQDGISTKDLSYLLGARVSSLNELLAKLEKSGYVTREPSEQDKRIMLVKLTEKGKNEQQPEPVDSGDIFSCLSDEEQKKLGEYLDRVIDSLHAIFGDDEEDWLKKMEAIRMRFGDVGAFWGAHRHGFPGGRGFSRDPRNGFGPNFSGRGGFWRPHGNRGHAGEEDNE
jgi:DNA-binding MarR family transcriptional regulator